MSKSRSKAKKNNNKKSKNEVPQDFTVGLAAADAVPVLFFGGSMILAGLLFASKIFLFGAFLCLFAGAAKVLWKFIVALKHKDIQFLFMQMRILMPIGLISMISGIIINRKNIAFSTIGEAALSFPPVLFFSLGLIGMLAMTVMMFTLDSRSKKSNWIEQTVNSAAQISFFIGLLLIV